LLVCVVDDLYYQQGDFFQALNSGHSTRLKSFAITSLTYGIYDSRTQRIRYTQAGHPPILCATNTQVNAWDDGDMPVGMLSDVDFSTHERLLTSGERLFFYSDGILEAENQDGVFLGDKRFSLSISEAAEMPLNECTTHIIQHVDAWLGESMAQDDITLLVLEVQ